jgi:hypothetical protein
MIMDEVGYELETGKQAVHKHFLFNENLLVLIVLEVIGIVVSLIASWRPGQGGIAAAMLVASLIGPVAKLLKYICVKCCYKNYIQAGTAAETKDRYSHVPQIVLIALVTLIFVVPIVFVCTQSSAFANALVDKVEEYVGNARQTVEEVSTQAEAQIEAVQAALGDQLEAAGMVEASQNGSQEEAAVATEASKDEKKKESSEAVESSKEGKKKKSSEKTESSKEGKKKKSSEATESSKEGKKKKSSEATEASKEGNNTEAVGTTEAP